MCLLSFQLGIQSIWSLPSHATRSTNSASANTTKPNGWLELESIFIDATIRTIGCTSVGNTKSINITTLEVRIQSQEFWTISHNIRTSINCCLFLDFLRIAIRRLHHKIIRLSRHRRWPRCHRQLYQRRNQWIKSIPKSSSPSQLVKLARSMRIWSASRTNKWVVWASPSNMAAYSSNAPNTKCTQHHRYVNQIVRIQRESHWYSISIVIWIGIGTASRNGKRRCAWSGSAFRCHRSKNRKSRHHHRATAIPTTNLAPQQPTSQNRGHVSHATKPIKTKRWIKRVPHRKRSLKRKAIKSKLCTVPSRGTATEGGRKWASDQIREQKMTQRSNGNR